MGRKLRKPRKLGKPGAQRGRFALLPDLSLRLAFGGKVRKKSAAAKIMSPLPIPADVIRWFRTVFAQCNRKLARTMSIVPNVTEPALDMALIDHLTQYGAPQVLNSGWTVRVDTHFLGGLRHFYGKWEIADIGLLVHYRKNGKVLRSKAAVLQSKRLYPKTGAVKEDLEVDYETGFARLADPESNPPLYVKTNYTFDENCRYGALLADDDQFKAIKQWTKVRKIPVYYQFYNPAQLPWNQSYPLRPESRKIRDYSFATRVLPAVDVIARLKDKPKNYSPSVLDLSSEDPGIGFGWRLEYFVADLLIRCKEGYIFQDIGEEEIFSLFNRRTGAIAAAVGFSLEMPPE